MVPTFIGISKHMANNKVRIRCILSVYEGIKAFSLIYRPSEILFYRKHDLTSSKSMIVLQYLNQHISNGCNVITATSKVYGFLDYVD